MSTLENKKNLPTKNIGVGLKMAEIALPAEKVSQEEREKNSYKMEQFCGL
jgi:hypothetical protein